MITGSYVLERVSMFARLAQLVINYPKSMLASALVVLAIAIASMALITPNLSTDFELGDSAESQQVANRLTEEFGFTNNGIILIFSGEGDLNNPDAMKSVDNAVSSVTLNPEFTQVITPGNTGSDALVSDDGEHLLVIAQLGPDSKLSPSELESIEHTVSAAAAQSGLHVEFGGRSYLENEITERTEDGLVKAEMVSIPITLIILVLVFGSLVAAGMPLVVGVSSIILAMAVVMAWSAGGFQSVFGINMITMLGLGLGIDYSLFLVKRYRDELNHHEPDEALTIALSTVGKAIFFSGITVLLGLGATQFFDMPPLKSLGQSAMVVTASAMFFGLVLLPSTLKLLGTRINKGHIGRRGQPVDDAGESRFWSRIANGVMARPVAVLLVTMGFLAFMALPMANIKLVQGGPDMLPEGSESRQVSEMVVAEFPRSTSDPIYVIVDSTDEAVIQRLNAEISGINGVAAVTVVPQDTATLMEVSSEFDAKASVPIVEEIRSLSTDSKELHVGGTAAFNLDSENIVMNGLLPAGLFVVVSAYIVLLLTFGSIFLPLKAIFMSGLSISASIGVVVWVFQSGHLEGLLNFEATGGTIHMVPILMATILFGLSMDYEVLLLSRVQEEWEATGDNRRSVAAGLAHTGQVVSGAATIMVAVFGAFVLADITMIKGIGFGLAFAVLLDATVVRGLLVPATMRLMGKWNWWAPKRVSKVVNRLGVSHTAPHAVIGAQPSVATGGE